MDTEATTTANPYVARHRYGMAHLFGIMTNHRTYALQSVPFFRGTETTLADALAH